MPNQSNFRADRCDRRVDGVLTLCNDLMHVKLLFNINVPGIESVWCSIINNIDIICFGNMYRYPTAL